MPNQKIKVLIVDDSAVVRRIVTEALSKDPDIEVVGTAIDPYMARDKIVELEPDVVTLDIEMPKMDGLTFLKILMQHKPMPVILLSSLTQEGSDYAMKALQLGAVEVLAKPGGSFSVGAVSEQLVQKVKAAAVSRVRRREGPELAARDRAHPARSVVKTAGAGTKKFHPRQIILLGASTGGTEALRDVLTELPAEMPGICIVQHIPAYFSRAFAQRLNGICELSVKEAEEGDIVAPGKVLIAPGDYHMLLKWTGSAFRVHLKQGPMVWHQRPAVDILFSSALDSYSAPHTIGAIFTGMGKDGADGLLKLREIGARTFAQSERTCVVFGMPKAAMENGGAQKMVDLEDFPRLLVNTAYAQAQAGAA